MAKLRHFRLRPKSRSHAARQRTQIKKLSRERSSKKTLALRPDNRAGGRRIAKQYGLPEVGARIIRPDRVQAVRTLSPRYIPDTEPSQSVTYEAIRDLLRERPQRKNICETRAERRGVLFAKNIAGSTRKSPGKGGTYRKTEDSKVSCERSF